MYKRTKGEKVLYAIIFLLFAAYALSMIVPFAWLLVNSLQNHIIYDINKANGSIFTLPKKLYFDNYIFSFQKLEANGSNIFAMFFNSVWYVAAYVGGSVLMSAFTGYALSKYKFKLKFQGNSVRLRLNDGMQNIAYLPFCRRLLCR